MVGWKIWRPERFIRFSPTVKLHVRVTSRIVDESGEDYVYPSDLFVPVRLPAAVVRRFRGPPVRSKSAAPVGRFGEPGKQIGAQAPRQWSSSQGTHFPTERYLEEGAQGGEQDPARGVPPLLCVDLRHSRSVTTRADIAQSCDNFNGSSQLTMVREGGVLCRLCSTGMFRRALTARAVA
jgi:hypothetical protein